MAAAAAMASALRSRGGRHLGFRCCAAGTKAAVGALTRSSPLLQSSRGIRTGFYADDPDFTDPEGPLFAVPLDARWRLMDDPALQASVLERNNVGMGMLVLNQQQGLTLAQVNELYRRLRNLEVNSFKRFVGLTAREPGPFCVGIDPKELLLASAASSRAGALQPFSVALLWHVQELAHLLATYQKPVVCYMSGFSRNAGAAMVSLASFSGAHERSEAVFDAVFSGLVPAGGSTHVLSQLPFHLGEFLALTGWPVRGLDLVLSGLVKHWLSADALPFLELTSEKQLEVSETDARRMLWEHSLPLPWIMEGGKKRVAGFRDIDSLPEAVIPVVAEIFGYTPSEAEDPPSKEKTASSQSSSKEDESKVPPSKEAKTSSSQTSSEEEKTKETAPEGAESQTTSSQTSSENQESKGEEGEDDEDAFLKEDPYPSKAQQDEVSKAATPTKSETASTDDASASEASIPRQSAPRVADDLVDLVEKIKGKLRARKNEEDAELKDALIEDSELKALMAAELNLGDAAIFTMVSERGREVGTDWIGEDCWFMSAEQNLVRRFLRREKRNKLADALVRIHFMAECLERMDKACPLASAVTLNLIRTARGSAQENEGIVEEDFTTFLSALRAELMVQQRLLSGSAGNAAKGLHAQCMGRSPPKFELDPVMKPQRVVNPRAQEDFCQYAEFTVSERSVISLSQHPRLRQFHPDYDPKTKMDHDPAWMAAEAKRWSADFLAEERQHSIRGLLGDEPPVQYGLSRWTRVDP